MFAEFDFSAAKRGPQASTFTELFADVLHPMPGSGLERPEVGADLHASLTVSFADAVHGVERQVLVTRQVLCGACAGRGQVAIAEAQCRQCQGAGQVRWARGHMVFSKPCAACGGEGRQTRERCAVCAGQGRGVRGEAVSVRVPAGDHGRRPAPRDGDGPRRPAWRPAGRSVCDGSRPAPSRGSGVKATTSCCELPVAVHEAALGARIDVPSLEGPVKLRIPPGTQAGQRLRVTGGGLVTATGGRGDLLFEVTLVLPRTLDERSIELMREFARIEHG